MSLLFSSSMLKLLEQSFSIILSDLSCSLFIMLFDVLEQNIHTRGQ